MRISGQAAISRQFNLEGRVSSSREGRGSAKSLVGDVEDGEWSGGVAGAVA